MQIAAFEVLRVSLIDLASFVEGSEPLIGKKYDNGKANRLRRLASYLRDCQAQFTSGASMCIIHSQDLSLRQRRTTSCIVCNTVFTFEYVCNCKCNCRSIEQPLDNDRSMLA